MSTQGGQHKPTGSAHAEVSPDDPIEEPASFQPLQEDHDAAQSTPPVPLPRFLEDAQVTGWRRRIPYPIRRVTRVTARWIEGPADPVVYSIKPVLPRIQRIPIDLLNRFVPKRTHRILLLAAWIFLWILTFALIKQHESDTTYLEPYGEPVSLGCGNAFWYRDDSCGLNGDKCRPFRDDAGFAFRCPANCRDYHLGEQRAVGDQELNYRSLVIGGPVDEDDAASAYRGDSWICAAAIHAGVISNAEGGCGVVRKDGSRPFFNSSNRHDISSVAFDSYFPQAYIFEKGIECKARDLRWPLLGVSATFSAILSLFTTSPAVFFFTCFSGLFWHTGLISDPPGHSSFRELFTIILGKYVPVMFVTWVMYDKMGVRRTLAGLTAQIEKTILWLGACWAGALDNYILSRAVPIQRLNGHDLQQQQGAKAALAIIIVVITFIVVQQVYFFRQEGRLVKYGKLYLMLLGGILLSLCLMPLDLNLRLHHYVFALLLIPGTSMQTRSSLVYQGFLIGLFINGIARWGWDPVLQTSYALRRDAALGSALPVLAHAPLINGVNATATALAAVTNSITFTWEPPPRDDQYYRIDGISVLINDVERFRGYFDADEVFEGREWTWVRKESLDVREYFRWSYMASTTSLDYSRAGVWDRDLGWIDPEPGASSVSVRTMYEDVR